MTRIKQLFCNLFLIGFVIYHFVSTSSSLASLAKLVWS